MQGVQSLIKQTIIDNICYLYVYKKEEPPYKIEGYSPDDVWKKFGILKKYDGATLFGIKYQETQNALLSYNSTISCTSNDWTNSDILDQVFNAHIKPRKIATSILVNWHQLFYNWKQQNSSIILFPNILKQIYPSNHIFDDKTLYAWKAMFYACGSRDITPFKNKSIEFWTKLEDYKSDKETLEKLYENGLLQISQSTDELEFIDKQKLFNVNEQFWNSFKFAYKNNSRGSDGKTRILSIIAETFTYADLKEHLKVNYNIIILLKY